MEIAQEVDEGVDDEIGEEGDEESEYEVVEVEGKKYMKVKIVGYEEDYLMDA